MSETGMYEMISSNKRKSVLLLILMILFVAAVAAVFGAYFGGKQAAGQYAVMFAAIGLGIAGIGALASYYSGTNVIMAVSGAHEAHPDDERQLHNLVEEMCIASGLPKPKIYIIEDSAPNAFATGRDPEHSAIAVTRGLMEKLNRNELMGVVAHEMSHVQNYDIRFATLMTVMVGTIVLMCDMFWRMSLFGGGRRRRRSRDSSDNQLQAIIAVVAIILMILAPLFAQIIQLASSRKREYLADATGAKMTRNPEALARALEKIAGDPDPLEAANRGTQQLYIVNPLKGKALAEKQNLFSTHPPIRERIARLRAMT
jgi:heat shock protein HtpX